MKFLLQADSILTASRGDIITSNPWNQRLRLAALELFAKSVNELNKTGVKPTHDTSGTVMTRFLNALKQQLRQEPVLESQSGDLVRPTRLKIVPPEMYDEDGHPLLDDVHHCMSYAATQYTPEDILRLGVSNLSLLDFCKMLGEVPPNKLHSKSNAWHSQLAGLLTDSRLVGREIENVELVPLRDGEWTTLSSENAYVAPENPLDVPDGLDEIVLVSPAAVQDRRRKTLFAKFGITQLNVSDVCDRILAKHQLLDANHYELSVECLLKRTVYLQKRSTTHYMLPEYYHDLKLVIAGSETLSQGHDLYMDDTEGAFKMSAHFKASGISCDFLHPIYLTQDNLRMARWLKDIRKVRALPKMVQDREISALFKYLVDQKPSPIWLVLIRDNWASYYFECCNTQFEITSLRLQPVACQTGYRKPLESVYFPSTNVMKEPFVVDCIDLAQIDDLEDPKWRLISLQLGFKIDADLNLFLAILRRLSMSPDIQVGHGDVDHILEKIQKLCNGKPDMRKVLQ